MTRELTEKILELHDAGCVVTISSGYVDGECHIYEATEHTLAKNKEFHKSLQLGDICFNSDVYSEYPLKEISAEDIKISKPIDDWQEIDISEVVS